MENKNGCDTIEDLWKVAQVCNINSPGITGTPDRALNFVQCSNVRDFMTMATMKCWHERGSTDFPPVVLKQVEFIKSSSNFRSNDSTDSKNKK